MNNTKGFSLIEVLVAMLLLGIGAACLGIIFQNAALLQRKSYERLQALELMHNQAELIKASPHTLFTDSVWIGDVQTRIVLAQKVIDTAAIDSMANLFDWSESDIEKLYKRPREIRLFVYIYNPLLDPFGSFDEMSDPAALNPDALERVMQLTVLQER